MRTLCLVAVMTFALLMGSYAAELKTYPGAKLDETATREVREAAAAAKMTGVTPTVYTTPDPFEKVTSFYKGLGKEYVMPRASGTSGKPKKFEKYELWEAFFIFDGAKDLATSKLWLKVQRPHIGEEVRDVTAIVVSEKK